MQIKQKNKVRWNCIRCVIILLSAFLIGNFNPIQAQAKSATGINIIPQLTQKHKNQLIRSVISASEEKRLAQTVYGEERHNGRKMEKAAVVWCVFNRIDDDDFGNSVQSVVTHSQFHGWFRSQKHPKWAHDIVRDVALRYALEKLGYKNVGRVLPKSYLYFSSHKGHNRFRKLYRSHKYWNWSLKNPYEN